ncbi:MAG: hypothetical protein AB1566_15690 [Chloroflexota bacterium]
MSGKGISHNLVRIPRLLSTGQESIYDLLKQSGYFEQHDQVDESGLREALSRHPEYIDEWISYSEDKRTDSGWYIKQEGNCVTVGYFQRGHTKNRDASYADLTDACAAFIRRELEDIRSGS